MTAKEFFRDWSNVVDFNELNKIMLTIDKEINEKNYNITPNLKDVLKVFKLTDYNNLKVVVLGQDPYPQYGVANGIAFSNNEETSIWSPSLMTLYNSCIYYSEDLPKKECPFPTLIDWCSQGVLLLNSALTVRVNEPGSHTLLWRSFTASLLHNISTKKPETIFVLLGNTAKSLQSYIYTQDNVITDQHPAFYARNNELTQDWYKEVNDKLLHQNISPIVWI